MVRNRLRIINMPHFDGGAQNNQIFYCREKNWGFLRKYDQMVRADLLAKISPLIIQIIF